MKLKAKKTIALIFSNGFYTWYRVKQDFDYNTSKGLKHFHEGDVIGVRDATSQKGMARLVFKGHITNVFSIKKEEFKAIAEDKLEPVNPEKTYGSKVLAEDVDTNKILNESQRIIRESMTRFKNLWDKGSKDLALSELEMNRDYFDRLYNKLKQA